MKPCPFCGYALANKATTCEKCGWESAAQANTPTKPPQHTPEERPAPVDAVQTSKQSGFGGDITAWLYVVLLVLICIPTYFYGLPGFFGVLFFLFMALKLLAG